MYYYGARYYDPRLSIFISVDPLAEKFPGWSPYIYTLNNPIRYVDLDGRAPEDVIIVFNKSTGKLAIMDLDHYKKGLPIKIVSAKDYIFGGIRNSKGKLTHNQVLVMDNIFSGGKSRDGIIKRENNKQRPISNGKYDLLDNNADTNPKHKGWFRLDKKDDKPYNDMDDNTGRRGFRLHMGTLSEGCITCDISQRDRVEEWDVVSRIIENTSSKEVPEKRGKQWLNPFSKLKKYGEVKVVGNDNIKIKE